MLHICCKPTCVVYDAIGQIIKKKVESGVWSLNGSPFHACVLGNSPLKCKSQPWLYSLHIPVTTQGCSSPENKDKAFKLGIASSLCLCNIRAFKVFFLLNSFGVLRLMSCSVQLAMLTQSALGSIWVPSPPLLPAGPVISWSQAPLYALRSVWKQHGLNFFKKKAAPMMPLSPFHLVSTSVFIITVLARMKCNGPRSDLNQKKKAPLLHILNTLFIQMQLFGMKKWSEKLIACCLAFQRRLFISNIIAKTSLGGISHDVRRRVALSGSVACK